MTLSHAPTQGWGRLPSALDRDDNGERLAIACRFGRESVEALTVVMPVILDQVGTAP